MTRMKKNPQSPKVRKLAGRRQEIVATTELEEEEALAEPNNRIAVARAEAVAEKAS